MTKFGLTVFLLAALVGCSRDRGALVPLEGWPDDFRFGESHWPCGHLFTGWTTNGCPACAVSKEDGQ